eukprot:5255010-Amphidinium_carterae.1
MDAILSAVAFRHESTFAFSPVASGVSATKPRFSATDSRGASPKSFITVCKSKLTFGPQSVSSFTHLSAKNK